MLASSYCIAAEIIQVGMFFMKKNGSFTVIDTVKERKKWKNRSDIVKILAKNLNSISTDKTGNP